MKKDKNSFDVIYLGKYNESEILTGPEKVAKRIFDISSKNNKALFIEYFDFFTQKKWSDKFFGKEVLLDSGKKVILRLGLINLILALLKCKTKVVHIITFERAAVLAGIIWFFKKYKIIYNVHGIVRSELKHYREVSPFFYFRNSVCEKIFFYSDKLLFLSESSIQLAQKYYNIENKKIKIIPNGIDPVFHHQGQAGRKSKSEELKFVFIGNIARKEKGFHTVLNILEGIKNNICLYVISNEIMKIKEGRHKIIFRNYMETNELAEFLSDKDIYISLPLHESFSIACAEAMAAGLIPVISGHVGMSRYILNNQNGFIIKEDNAEKLDEIIDLLNGNLAAKAELSLNASKIYNELSWDHIYKVYEDVYNKITGEKLE